MTINMLTTPNHIHIFGNPHLDFWFGGIPEVSANVLCSHPHIRIASEFIRWELTPKFAFTLNELLPGQLERLGCIPDLHDAIGVEE